MKAIKYSIEYWQLVELSKSSIKFWWYMITSGKYKEIK